MRIITIDPILKEKCPSLILGCIESTITIEKHRPDLWETINETTDQLSSELEISDISQLPAIQSSRKGYKSTGKDPARYRLSAEALLRRVVNGKGLYQINNAVDLLNLVSIKSGYSIGGYDADHIQGDITFGIGKEGEPYEAIGRGSLNIAHLPVFRDEVGAFGSPTSDSLRTSVTNQTSRFLMIIISFHGKEGLEAAMEEAEFLLVSFAEGKNIEKWVVS